MRRRSRWFLPLGSPQCHPAVLPWKWGLDDGHPAPGQAQGQSRGARAGRRGDRQPAGHGARPVGWRHPPPPLLSAGTAGYAARGWERESDMGVGGKVTPPQHRPFPPAPHTPTPASHPPAATRGQPSPTVPCADAQNWFAPGGCTCSLLMLWGVPTWAGARLWEPPRSPWPSSSSSSKSRRTATFSCREALSGCGASSHHLPPSGKQGT